MATDGKDDEAVFRLQPGLNGSCGSFRITSTNVGRKRLSIELFLIRKVRTENLADGGLISLKELGVLVMMLWGDRISVPRGPRFQPTNQSEGMKLEPKTIVQIRITSIGGTSVSFSLLTRSRTYLIVQQPKRMYVEWNLSCLQRNVKIMGIRDVSLPGRARSLS